MVVVRLAAMAAAIGGAAVPVAAHASGSAGPTLVGSGSVSNYPGYTWQVVFFPAASNPDGVNENVVFVYNNTGAPTMDPDADSLGYALFTSALANTVNPPQLPAFPPPTTAPPSLDANPNPDPDAPNARLPRTYRPRTRRLTTPAATGPTPATFGTARRPIQEGATPPVTAGFSPKQHGELHLGNWLQRFA